MFKFASKPLTSSQVILEALKMYKKTFTKVWYVFIPYWLTVVYGIMGYFFGFTNDILSIKEKFVVDARFIYLLGAFIVGLFAIFFKSVAYYHMRRACDKKQNFKESFSFVLERCFRILGNQIIAGIAVAALCIPFGLPGMFLAGLLIFCIPLILFDKASVTSAMKESAGLVWGKWWHVCFSVIIPLVLMMVFSAGLVYLKMYSIITSFIVSFVIVPIYIATVLVLFNDLKLRVKR